MWCRDPLLCSSPSPRASAAATCPNTQLLAGGGAGVATTPQVASFTWSRLRPNDHDGACAIRVECSCHTVLKDPSFLGRRSLGSEQECLKIPPPRGDKQMRRIVSTGGRKPYCVPSTAPPWGPGVTAAEGCPHGSHITLWGCRGEGRREELGVSCQQGGCTAAGGLGRTRSGKGDVNDQDTSCLVHLLQTHAGKDGQCLPYARPPFSRWSRAEGIHIPDNRLLVASPSPALPPNSCPPTRPAPGQLQGGVRYAEGRRPTAVTRRDAGRPCTTPGVSSHGGPRGCCPLEL